jgi:SAM-dependent methyltransferase
LSAPLPGGRLYRCAACHLAFRHPLLPKDTIDALYQAGDMAFWQYEPGHRRDWAIARRWLRQRQRSGSVLDVGCYDGAFLAYLGAGWEHFGIEIHEQAAARARARGVEIVGNDAERLQEIPRRFDVVVAFDVIEHMRDPRTLLARMVDRTRPGGAVIVGSGDADAPSWKLMGSRYWYCALPEHLTFFSESWCRATAQALGLRLAFAERYSHAQRRDALRVAAELAKNLLFRFAPGLFAALRAGGFGGIDVSEHRTWKRVPPAWITAKDHLLAVFERT